MSNGRNPIGEQELGQVNPDLGKDSNVRARIYVQGVVIDSPPPGGTRALGDELVAVDPAVKEKLDRLSARRDEIRENSRRASTRRNYAYWVKRWEKWMYDAGREFAAALGVEFRLYPPQVDLLELFLTDFAQSPPSGVDPEDWVPPAPGTISNVVSALKYETERLDFKWEETPALKKLLSGLRRWLADQTLAGKATPLVREELITICEFLLSPTPRTQRDCLTVLLFAGGLGLTEAGRVTAGGVRDLLASGRLHPGLCARIEEIMKTPPFNDLPADSPALGAGETTSGQQVRQILLRCAREAGHQDWKTTDGLSAVDALAIVDHLSATPDPARLRDHAMLTVGWALALRRSELCRATVDWVVSERGRLIYEVHHSKTNFTNRPERMPLAEATTNPLICPTRALSRWLEYLHEQGMAEPGMPLFPAIDRHGNVSDDPIGDDAVAEMIRKRVGESGVALTEDQIAGYSGHSLRRGFITSAVRAGVPLLDLARHTRHKNLEVLMEYYDYEASLDPTRNPAGRLLG